MTGYPLSSAFGELSERQADQASLEEYIDEDQNTRVIHPVDVGQKAVDSTAPLHHAAKKYDTSPLPKSNRSFFYSLSLLSQFFILIRIVFHNCVLLLGRCCKLLEHIF